MNLELVEKLAKKSLDQFSDKKEHHDFLMFEIQNHLVEINDLIAKKDPHSKKEIADLAILCQMLAINEDVNSKIFSERLVKFKSKISSS